MSTIRASASATVQDYIRQLRVGEHDVIEDQWRAESDAVNTVLLNNTAALAALNPGLVICEPITLGVADAFITVGSAVGTLLGVLSFSADGVVETTVTVWTPDADQVTNPGKIAPTGATVAGTALVYYLPA